MGSRGKSLSESARRIANKNHKGDSLISEEKATDGYSPNELFDELRRTNTKFSEPDTVFITRDQDGKITWLERGSEGSGLKHIVERHSGQFEQAFGIRISGIPNHIQEVIEKGRITYSTPDK